jgi:hypothetical protein
MSEFNLLVDTHVVIGLEDNQPVQASLAELVRLSNQFGVGLFVDGANYDDVGRDKDSARRAITFSKLEKFQKLRGIPPSDQAQLESRFGSIKSENDRSDVRLLATIEARAADFLISEDIDLHRRASRAGLAPKVLTVKDAVEWLRQTFQALPVRLPYVVERLA